jgi:hypothetical protein
MGIRLVMESTSRHTPEELTWRERYVLVVLASSAIDATRELPPGIETSPELAARLKLSRTQLYLVLSALVEKGALVHLERGRNGVKAVYAIAPFTPGSERPGDPDVPPVENPLESPSNRDPSAPVKGPGSDAEGSRFEVPKHPGSRDPAPYIGIRDFKTGGKTPLPPTLGSLVQLGFPTDPGEGEEELRERTPAAIAALVDAIRAIREDWSTRSVRRALDDQSVRERPWPLVCEAFAIMARDPETQYPGRLPGDGPWWPAAERKCRRAAASQVQDEDVHEFEPNGNGDCRRCPLPADSRFHRKRRVS